MNLTKDSDVLICLLYKQYLEKRKEGCSKQNAKSFGGSSNIQKNIVPKWSFDDVEETCRELDRAGLLKCIYADDIVYNVFLSDNGIIYMENRFKDNVDEVLAYIEKFRNLLPF